MSLSRRQILLGGAGLIAGDALLYEPRTVVVTTRDLAVPSLPAALEGLRIAQLTDVHLRSLHAAALGALQALAEAQPHVVVLTGDIIESPEAMTTLSDFATLARGSVATFAIPGNWEYWGKVPMRSLKRAYERADVELLVNDVARVELGGAVLEFAGFDDPVAGKPMIEQTLQHSRTADVRFWLVHAPGWVESIPADAPTPHMIFSGHTHGGQIRPGWAPFTPPGSGRFVAGLYTDTHAPLYVSRGIGTSIIPARFGCRPELPIFTLRRA